MKKPCIIGTKIATQVLKDGDLVEVDADNGVVKILESVGSITTLEKGNHEDLYDQFMKSLQGDTSFSFFARCSILCIGSVPWLKNKYSPQQKKQGFLLLLVDKDLVMEVANSDLHDSYAVNTFKDFLSGKTNIQCLKREFTETCKKIDHLYAQEILDPQKLINECAELMMQLCAKTLYIENFSKRIAEEGLQIKIADDIWEHATSPSFEHFETRWLKAVKKSKTPEEVDYVFQDYYFLPTDEDLRILWETKKKEKIKNKADSKPVLSKLEPWVEFTQFVMMLRDLRKDPYAKIQSLICKSARLLYPDVPDELLAHINLFEVADNTLPSVEVLKKRNTTPYVLLLKEDTGFSYDYDAYDRIKALVEKIDENQDTVYGDTASRGKYKGIVRIVRNPEDDFNKGDILCT
jgi:hypothetical protein